MLNPATTGSTFGSMKAEAAGSAAVVPGSVTGVVNRCGWGNAWFARRLLLPSGSRAGFLVETFLDRPGLGAVMTWPNVSDEAAAGTLRCPGGTWSYDTWGTAGRPVLLIHSVLFDRTLWWPVAAELHRQCTPRRRRPARPRTVPGTRRVQRRGPGRWFGRFALRAPRGTRTHRCRARRLGRFGEPDRQTLRHPYRCARRPHKWKPRCSRRPAGVPPYLRRLVEPSQDRTLLQAYGGCIDVDPWSDVGSDAPSQR